MSCNKCLCTWNSQNSKHCTICCLTYDNNNIFHCCICLCTWNPHHSKHCTICCLTYDDNTTLSDQNILTWDAHNISHKKKYHNKNKCVLIHNNNLNLTHCCQCSLTWNNLNKKHCYRCKKIFNINSSHYCKYDVNQ